MNILSIKNPPLSCAGVFSITVKKKTAARLEENRTAIFPFF
jgi:hypothetical protein